MLQRIPRPASMETLGVSALTTSQLLKLYGAFLIVVKSLCAVVNDIFGAGSDTTSTTLSWLILYLAKFPKTQAKLQAELDEVVGKSRAPTLADRSK